MDTMISWPIIKYVMTAAFRDRLVLAVLILIALGASISVFLGSAAVTESDRFALVFAAGGLRMAGVAGLVLFAVFHIRRSFDTRDVDYLLSRPVSRAGFLVSHAAAFSALALLLAFCVVIAVLLLAPHMAGAGHVLWGASIAAEFVIMINAALFFAMVLSSAVTASLAVLALYVLARLIGQIFGIIDSGLPIASFETMSTVMEVISLIVPRLDLMGQTSWLLYGPDGSIGLGAIALQGVIYPVLIIMAALVDLVRRQF